MNSEVIRGSLFNPVSELDLIQLLFPQLPESGRNLFLKLRATTLLLTRGLNADLEDMDLDTRAHHDRFVHEREVRWVVLHKQVRDSGFLDGFSRVQKTVFHNDFSKVRFNAAGGPTPGADCAGSSSGQ